MQESAENSQKNVPKTAKKLAIFATKKKKANFAAPLHINLPCVPQRGISNGTEFERFQGKVGLFQGTCRIAQEKESFSCTFVGVFLAILIFLQHLEENARKTGQKRL